MRNRSLLAVAALAAVTWMAPIVALAATPEPSGDWSAYLGAPGPEECRAQPVTAEALVGMLATAVAQPAPASTPAAPATIDDLPSGDPAGAEDAVGALTTMREVLACVNAGSFGRALALFTPNGIVQLLLGTSSGSIPLTEDQLRQSIEFLRPLLEGPATPVAESQRAGMSEIREVRRLPDGRILVVSVGSVGGNGGLAYAILIKVGDQWLIDAAGSIAESATPTPTG